ncbi:type II toxin-antitoxin system YafQ family toxin [Candidatus Saccharibacteria bacterium]|nr:type II toxin-antitoxin system YafQ family toxin [Candidatus Saccharibacteria bacterium]
MLEAKYEKQFKKDIKLAKKRGYNMQLLAEVITYMINEEEIPPKYKDHALINNKKYKNVRELHVNPDWLLIYRIEKGVELLRLVRTGTHSDLFNK